MMKKLFILTLMCLVASPSFAFLESTSSNDHNMMILRQQQFRFQELDTNKDFQTQKQKKLKEDEVFLNKINNRKVIKSFSEPKEFVEVNGEIKIKGVE